MLVSDDGERAVGIGCQRAAEADVLVAGEPGDSAKSDRAAVALMAPLSGYRQTLILLGIGAAGGGSKRATGI